MQVLAPGSRDVSRILRIDDQKGTPKERSPTAEQHWPLVSECI
jgi:hypothetical protein